MCEFISWIEKDGNLLYLTDADVFSKHGRETLAGTRHNDVLGHGAIRKFFGLGEHGGIEREVRDFWKPGALPAEIAKKVRAFDAHWGKLFNRHFANDDLCYIVENAPLRWKEKAAKQLIRQDEYAEYASRIIRCRGVSDEQKARAWDNLMDDNAIEDDLVEVATFAKYKWARAALNELVRGGPLLDQLEYIRANCTPKLRPAVLKAIKEEE